MKWKGIRKEVDVANFPEFVCRELGNTKHEKRKTSVKIAGLQAEI
jgi:hypothetical protein